jgi:hypothetical protein
MPRVRWRDTTNYENRTGRWVKLKPHFRTKPPCPAFWGVAPRAGRAARLCRAFEEAPMREPYADLIKGFRPEAG